ncbi:MAG TPA: hypothetical protein VH107_03800 [Lacipirellulaceae bacterium]|nr:hypothetical protein [Lacipirellulaceae bacterium]
MERRIKHLRSPRCIDRPTMRRLATDEDGAAYTLSYVMVIPVYALLMCMIIESVLMMTAKLGTVYAAFAAVRTATVWSSATTWEKAQEKAQHAATKAMTPFSSGTHGGIEKAANADAIAYETAYHAYAKTPIADKFLLNKYGYAQEHVKVEINGPPTDATAPITAKVTYEFPFNVPGIARLFGKKGNDGKFYFRLTSEATLDNEAPQDNQKTIGIGYGILE